MLKHDPKYQQVRELVEALDLLSGVMLSKAMCFVGQQVRTNNHVERMNRRLRFAEKVRYRWRRRKWVVRWVVVLLAEYWQQAATTAASGPAEKRSGPRSPPRPGGRSKRAA